VHELVMKSEHRQVLTPCGRLDLTPATTTRSALLVRY